MSKPKADLPRRTSDLPPLLPRPAATHKGQAGHVAIVAGSRGMSGAAVLSGLGALRGGAGLVRVYCPASIQATVAAGEPCFMTVALGEDREGRLAVDPPAWRESLSWAHALAIGPGIGQREDLAGVVAGFVRDFAGPVVIDADGLNNLANGGDAVLSERDPSTTVVTPHPGEMARLRRGAGLPTLRGESDETRLRIAHEFARARGVTVVLKGHRSVVCTPDQAYINTSGNPGMATGGMGDVLTGLVAALLAQGLSAFDAARLAVHVHGVAGDLCAKQIGPVGYLARDVADALPPALASASRPRMGFR